MQKLVFKNANDVEIDLTDGTKYGITNWSGFSNVNNTIQTQTVPFSDGAVYLDSLLGERELSVTVAVNDSGSLETRYGLKRELISALNPKLGEGTLTYTNDFISKQITVVPDIPIFANKNSDDSGTLKAEISFTACSPFWEDTEETSIYLSKGITKITNVGDVPVPVKIKIETEATSLLRIRNITQNKKIELKNVTHNVIEINTALGNKTVTGSSTEPTVEDDYDIVDSCYDSVNDLFYAITDDYKVLQKNNDTNEWKVVHTAEVALNSIESYNGYVVIAGNEIIITYHNSTWTTEEVSGYNLKKVIWSKLFNEFAILGTASSAGVLIFTSINSTVSQITFSETIYDFTESDDCIAVLGSAYIFFIDSDQTQTTESLSGLTKTYTLIVFNSTGYALFNTSGYACLYQSNTFTEQNVSAGSLTFALYDFENNRYWVGKSSAYTRYSDNLSSWTDISYSFVNGKYVNSLGMIIFCQTLYNIYTIQGLDLTSIGYTEFYAQNFSKIIYSENYSRFYGINGTKIYVSDDSKEWELLTTFAYLLLDICEENGIIIVVGESGLMYRSEDGDTFTQIDLSLSYDIESVIYGNNIFFATYRDSDDLHILLSSDGNSWTDNTAVNTESESTLEISNPASIVWASGMGKYVIGTGRLCSSTDGINWTPMEETGYVNANTTLAVYNPDRNYVVITGHDGGYMVTYDGLTVIGMEWDNSDFDMYKGAYDETHQIIVLVGYSYIHWSYDGETWYKQEHTSGDAVWCFYNPLLQTVEGYCGVYFKMSLLEGENIIALITSDSDMTLSLLEGENIIALITSDSDMTLSLLEGENIIQLLCEDNCSGTLTFRNRYIGV